MLTTADIANRVRAARTIADRIARLRRARVMAACRAAGASDPGLLHNALCGLAHGRPWVGIDYSKARYARRLLDDQFRPFRIVDALYSRLMSEIQAQWKAEREESQS